MAGDTMGFMGGGDPSPPGMGSPGGPGYVDPFQGVPVKDMDSGCMTIPEMNALREWEDKHERELEEKTRKEEADKKERRKAASDELQKWHEERATGVKKHLATNRADEETVTQARAAALKPGANPWERVADLIDATARAGDDDARDTSRMRALLIQLKSNPVAAAA